MTNKTAFPKRVFCKCTQQPPAEQSVAPARVLGASGAGAWASAATRAPPTKTSASTAHTLSPRPGESPGALQPKSVYGRPPRCPPSTTQSGRAIDNLRHDYPGLFDEKRPLHLHTHRDSSTHRRLQVSPSPDDGLPPPRPPVPPTHPTSHPTPTPPASPDPSAPLAASLQGVTQYERVFDMLRFLRRTTMQDSELTYRIVVHEGTIRVRWCAKMHVRDPALGFTSLNVIDGVSVYDLDTKGKISRHKIETIVMAKPTAEAAGQPRPALAHPRAAGARDGPPSSACSTTRSRGEPPL